jgi:hypothetical protein
MREGAGPSRSTYREIRESGPPNSSPLIPASWGKTQTSESLADILSPVMSELAEATIRCLRHIAYCNDRLIQQSALQKLW